LRILGSNRARRLVVTAVLALGVLGILSATGFARTGLYSWPGAVILHVHTTPDGSSPGYVQSDPYYIDCPNACDRPYDVGQSVTLWAHPTGGFAFTSWTTGPCAGSTTNPCTFTITADTDVTADFSGKYVPTPPPDNGMKTLHIIVDGFFCVCSSVKGVDLGVHGVQKSAAHASGSGCTKPTHAVKAVAGVSSCDLWAGVFSSDEKIQCFNNGFGICEADYPTGSTVDLLAETCGAFLGWEDDGGAPNPREIVMNTDKTVAAAFLFEGLCP
jgi:hypothetical protein